MNFPIALYVFALILTLLCLIQDRAKSLHLWACLLVCLGLTYALWGPRIGL